VYHKSTEWGKKEELKVFYDERFSLLPIANIPSKRCSDAEFPVAEWDFSGDGLVTEVGLHGLGNFKPLSYSRCVKPNHP